MISSKKILKYIVILCLCGSIFNAFAIDQAAKEEISPPSEDGPLTIEQIPPINSERSPLAAAAMPGKTPIPLTPPTQSEQSINQVTPMQP